MGGLFDLCMSILCSCTLVLYFKFVEKQQFALLPVIVTNYFVCAGMGIAQAPDFWQHLSPPANNPIPIAVLLGAMCIGIFFLIGILTQRVGAGIVAILTKMCVVIPIVFAWLYLGESLSWLKMIGIGMALGALWLIQRPSEETETTGIRQNWLPALCVFLGSGIIDTLMKVVETNYLPHLRSSNDFMIVMLGTAALIGLVIALWQIFQGKTELLNYKAWLAGIGLGIPNYFSFYFLLKALTQLPATVFFPSNNVGIVLLLCLIGIVWFKETYNRWNYVGMGIALLAILLMAV